MAKMRVRVSVVVKHKGSILLIKERTEDGCAYSLPGGGVEYLESIADAARREVMEETGVTVTYERLLWIDERIDLGTKGKHTIGIGVLAVPDGEALEPVAGGVEDEDIVWAGWVSLDQFHSLPVDNPKRRDQVWRALTDPDYTPDYIGNVFT